MARLLAFVSIYVESPLMDYVVEELTKLANMEEVYEVTGEYDVICLVSANDIQEFRDLIVNKIMKTKGVRSTVTDVVLYSHGGSKRNDGNRPTSGTSG